MTPNPTPLPTPAGRSPIPRWQDLEVVGFEGPRIAPCAPAVPWVRWWDRNVYAPLPTGYEPDAVKTWHAAAEFERRVRDGATSATVELGAGAGVKAVPHGLIVYFRPVVFQLTGATLSVLHRRARLSQKETHEWRLQDQTSVVYASEQAVLNLMARVASVARERASMALADTLRAQQQNLTLGPYVQKIEDLAKIGLGSAPRSDLAGRQELYAYLGAADLLQGQLVAAENLHQFLVRIEFPSWRREDYLLLVRKLPDLARTSQSLRNEPEIARAPLTTDQLLTRLKNDRSDNLGVMTYGDDRPLRKEFAERMADNWRAILESQGWSLPDIDTIIDQVKKKLKNAPGDALPLPLEETLGLATHESFWYFPNDFEFARSGSGYPLRVKVDDLADDEENEFREIGKDELRLMPLPAERSPQAVAAGR